MTAPFFSFGPSEPDRPPAKIKLRRPIIVAPLGGIADAHGAGEVLVVSDRVLRQLPPDSFDFLRRETEAGLDFQI